MGFVRFRGRVTGNPLLVQLSSVAVAALAVGAVSLLALRSVDNSGHSARRNADGAALAASVAAASTAAEGVLLVNRDPSAVVEVARRLDETQAASSELADIAPSAATLDLEVASGRTYQRFSVYLVTGSASDLAEFQTSLQQLREASGALGPEFADAAASDANDVSSTSMLAQLLMLGLVGIAALSVGSTTWLVSRRLAAALQAVRDERDALESVTASAERRNRQFEALYQVVNEITENLNLRYVVQTTVTESLGLFAADSVVLRVLRSGSLALEGAAPPDIRTSVPAEVPLGSGVAGRVARRGRSIHVGDRSGLNHSTAEAPAGAVAALVVPLIVGARVVGTMELWSSRAGAFTTDDDRMAELMASQVATAVAAADTHEVAQHQARHDALTGLPNRRQLEDDVATRHAQALTHAKSTAVVMIDIDHFKRFNDDFGHRVGDVTLQRVAEVLRAGIREHDSVYRYGGEEFTMVLPNVGMDDALQLVDRIRAAVERTPLTGETLEPVGPVTISAGIAVAPEHGRAMDILIELADHAMYEAKASGRNRVVGYRPPSDGGLAPWPRTDGPADAGERAA
ncbi:MAG: GGDEF domain-containing protein [Dehalococcoidia bacterium]|nr:GGDEF domain-containing protein [Dehalococcoidia bacterium]